MVVRAEWTRVERAHRGNIIIEEAQAGTVISGRLLEMGNEVQAGTRTTAAAVAEALRARIARVQPSEPLAPHDGAQATPTCAPPATGAIECRRGQA